MNFTVFFFFSPFARKKQECLLRVAGVNEDRGLGFPTDPPVSEPACLCLTFDSELLLYAHLKRREDDQTNKEI